MSGQEYGQAEAKSRGNASPQRTLERTSSARTLTYGRSCSRCKVYFVTDDQNAYTCPWCHKVESGGMLGIEVDRADTDGIWNGDVDSIAG